MRTFFARLQIRFMGIHGICHRNAIYKLCAELDLK
jgi:hypothetical protein